MTVIISHKEVIKMIDYSKIEKEMNLYGQVQGLMNYFTINNLKEINILAHTFPKEKMGRVYIDFN